MDNFLKDLREFCKTFEFDKSQTFIQSPDGKGNPFYGCNHDDETRKHLSEIQSTKVGKLNQFYGKKHKPEVIEQNRQKNIEILTKLKGKKVSQYKMNGEYIATYDSVRCAARSLDLKCYNEISKCCRGTKENYQGYIWKYT
ncbi:Nuclease associated modular domain 3 [uncultured Caudovirales phage]|uniref:Nuclease associated modular domain 3 n=1 Tax=uncultured Caudovirales phage TaxID=2100421 RepID=A0A6J5LIZ6_9CAUD|nr:Nuclease associated modular domain 3 [uncultured Caudovirales phage]